MAEKYVKLTVSPLPGVTPIGVTINYSVGNIPTCVIDIAPAPSDEVKIDKLPGAESILSKLDSYKRKDDITVDIEVGTHVGPSSSKDPVKHKLQFAGMLDGISLANSVGSTSYQAIVKGHAQTLLEVTITMPGLYPTSENIYKIPFNSTMFTAPTSGGGTVSAWHSAAVCQGIDFKASPIEFYTKFLIGMLKRQLSGWEQFIGGSQASQSRIRTPMEKILKDKVYTVAVEKAVKILEGVDLSSVTGGYLSKLAMNNNLISSYTKDFFFSSSPVLLENYLNYLNQLGCTLVFGQSKSFVVPINSFIEQEHTPPEKRRMQDKPNMAYPADYNGYVYNDNGYRDVATVLLSNVGYYGGTLASQSTTTWGPYVGSYTDEEHIISKASGVLIMHAHPFMAFSDAGANKPEANQKGKAACDAGSMYEDKEQITDVENSEDLPQGEKKAVEDNRKPFKDMLDNYAEQKFLQVRYGDRQGSMTLSFNPNWVPGASGTLFIRSTEMFLEFYVTSVTHRVDLSPPANGSAITTINFNCGRMGKQTIGVSKDEFLGYDGKKEKDFQKKFIADITGES